MGRRLGWIADGVGYIPLTQGQIALVNPERVEELQKLTWHAQWIPHMKSFYACSHGELNGRKIRLYMHREILGLGRGRDVLGDHISGDTLDNRDCNLRRVDKFQNAHNRRYTNPKYSGFVGVRFKAKKWEVAYQHRGVYKYLGRFDIETDARRAYAEAVMPLRGEYVHSQPLQ